MNAIILILFQILNDMRIAGVRLPRLTPAMWTVLGNLDTVGTTVLDGLDQEGVRRRLRRRQELRESWVGDLLQLKEELLARGAPGDKEMRQSISQVVMAIKWANWLQWEQELARLPSLWAWVGHPPMWVELNLGYELLPLVVDGVELPTLSNENWEMLREREGLSRGEQLQRAEWGQATKELWVGRLLHWREVLLERGEADKAASVRRVVEGIKWDTWGRWTLEVTRFPSMWLGLGCAPIWPRVQ